MLNDSSGYYCFTIMKKKINFFKKPFNLIPGSVYGLLSFGISLFTHLLGVLLYPDYDMINMAISYLGDGYGGIIYRLGLIITGIIGIPFFVYLGKSLNNNNSIEPIRKTALAGSIVYCISLIFVGYFWRGNYMVSFLHGFFAFICWVDGLIFISLFSVLMLKDEKFPKLIAYFGFIIAGTFLLHLSVFRPITQWIMTLSIMMWVSIVSSYMLYKQF